MTKAFSILPKRTLSWLKNTVLRRLCQDEEILMTMLWLKTSFLFSKRSASTGRRLRPLRRLALLLTTTSSSTTTSVFKLKQNWHRWSCGASSLLELYSLHHGPFCAVRTIWFGSFMQRRAFCRCWGVICTRLTVIKIRCFLRVINKDLLATPAQICSYSRTLHKWKFR